MRPLSDCRLFHWHWAVSTVAKTAPLTAQSCSFLHFHRWHIWYYFNWHEIITFAAPEEIAHVLNVLFVCLLKKYHQSIRFLVMYRVNVVKRIHKKPGCCYELILSNQILAHNHLSCSPDAGAGGDDITLLQLGCQQMKQGDGPCGLRPVHTQTHYLSMWKAVNNKYIS